MQAINTYITHDLRLTNQDVNVILAALRVAGEKQQQYEASPNCFEKVERELESIQRKGIELA